MRKLTQEEAIKVESLLYSDNELLTKLSKFKYCCLDDPTINTIECIVQGYLDKYHNADEIRYKIIPKALVNDDGTLSFEYYTYIDVYCDLSLDL